MATATDFQKELDKVFQDAKRKGMSYVIVVSGDLHRLVGDYPGHNHRMPVCCRVMRENMRPGDVILKAPPKGNGATLEVKYLLQDNVVNIPA